MGEISSHKGNFQAMRMGLVSKYSEEHSPVRGQGSRVGGRGSGVKIGVTSWCNLKKSSKKPESWYLTPVLTPDPWPLTPDHLPLTGECSSEHFGPNPIFIAWKLPLWEQFSPISSFPLILVKSASPGVSWVSALTSSIFGLWRWGWYQNVQKSIPGK